MDPSIYRFIYIILGILSVMLPGTVYRLIIFIVALILLMIKIKEYRERPEENPFVVFDIMGIVFIIIMTVVLTVMGAALENNINEMMPSSSYSEKDAADILSETAERICESI